MLTTVLFDVNGTLTDPSAIGEPWGLPELGERALGAAVSTAMVDALLGEGGRPFSDHMRSAIEVIVADEALDRSGIPDAVRAASSLPARTGAGEALKLLGDAGLRLIALTNSGEDAGRRTLEACGLARYLQGVIGVDRVQTFKPHPRIYAYTLTQLATVAEQVALVATHPWDLAGASHAGLHTAWVTHGARGWPSVFPGPDLQADALVDLAQALRAAGGPGERGVREASRPPQ